MWRADKLIIYGTYIGIYLQNIGNLVNTAVVLMYLIMQILCTQILALI